MGRWNHTLLAVGSGLLLTTSIVQPAYASSSIASADKPIYMMSVGAKTFAANDANITLVRQKDGSLHLCNEDGSQEYLSFAGYIGGNQYDTVYEVTRVVMKDPAKTFFIINSTIGVHPMNTGLWIVGQQNGKWKTYVTRNSLGKAGLDLNTAHRLTITPQPGTDTLFLVSKHESMPAADQPMTESRITTDFQASIRWDEKAQNFAIKRNGDNGKTIASSSALASHVSRINENSKRIPLDQLRLGGIGIGDSLDYVKSIYGEPTKIGKRGKNYLYNGLYGYDITYGDSFNLDVIEEKDGREIITNIASIANNGLAMPNGLKVESPVGDIFKNFGMPWCTISSDDGHRGYIYRSVKMPKILFMTDKTHVITGITIVEME